MGRKGEWKSLVHLIVHFTWKCFILQQFNLIFWILISRQDDFLDVIYWSKQVLGIFMGVIWGIFPLKGIVGLVL